MSMKNPHKNNHVISDIMIYTVDELADYIKDIDASISTIPTKTECKIYTLTEAKELATLLSCFYPEPHNAILGIMELLINAIEHGNLNIGYEQKGKLLQSGLWLDEINQRQKQNEYNDKYVQVSFKKENNIVILTITDMGNGFDYTKRQSLTLGDIQSLNGRGILLATSLTFDDLTYNEKGNQVTATIKY